MLKLTLISLMINSLVTPNMTHPVSLGITLLIQTMLTCLITRLLLSSLWIPATIFLVMIGGLMILFIYMTSICSNKKFIFKKTTLTQLMMMITMMMLMNFLTQEIPMAETLNLKDLFNLEFLKLYSPMNLISSNFMFIYLLLMLIVMISILPLNKGPLRKKY